MTEYIVVNDRTRRVISEHETKEAAVALLERRGYNHYSGWTYRNPETRDYCHVSSVSQYQHDNAIVSAAAGAGMTVDAYLQR